MKTTAYIQTGSNEGERLFNLQQASKLLEEQAGSLLCQSPIYETAAWGVTDQPDFLNQVIAISTDRPPFTLLDIALEIEKEMGRERRVKWGQRLIDIDLLFYGRIRICTERLTIPHPYLQERNFVLRPLLDIAPDFIHPGLNTSVAELARRTADNLDAKVYQR